VRSDVGLAATGSDLALTERTTGTDNLLTERALLKGHLKTGDGDLADNETDSGEHTALTDLLTVLAGSTDK
jgi:hypothetical protein